MKIIELERKPPRFTDALLYSVRRHGVIVAMTWSLSTLALLAVYFSKVASSYFLLVAAHLLGSFYWWHKDKLNWDV